MVRLAVMAALVAAATGADAAALAQTRWVEDEAVLAPAQVRGTLGGGWLLMTFPGVGDDTNAILGGGGNFEAAAGLGHGLELGGRLGLRDAEGRAVRADEAVRVLDTETFGTGLGAFANPELRLRWRVLRRGFVEAGLEDRVVLPLPSYADVTEVLGAWASLHGGRTLRLDVAINGVLIWRSFAAGRAWQPGLGAPARLFVNLTDRLSAYVAVTTHYLAATSYTAAHVTVVAGIGLGYRYRSCDLHAGYQLFDVFSADVVNGTTTRNGLGLQVSCRMGWADRAPVR